MTGPGPIPCPTCGAIINGRYCPNCGEKRLAPADLAVRHYLEQLLQGFTNADGKLWTTLRAVTLRPGELSLAYMEGRRSRYMRPVALFFVLNLVYFLFPLFETFNTGLKSQLHFQVYSGWATALVHQVVATAGSNMDSFAAAYAVRSTSNAKLMLVLMVFLLAPVLAVVYAGRMRHFSGHVTFAFEAMIFNLLWATIALSMVVYLVELILIRAGGIQGRLFGDNLYSLIALVMNLHLFLGAGRRLYRCSWAGSAWRGVVVFVLLFIVLNAYRLLLFLLTTWQVSRAL